MNTALRLESVKIPFGPTGPTRRCLTDPTRQYLGLLADDGLHVLSYQDGLANPLHFSVPAERLLRTAREETVQVSLSARS